MTKKRIALLTVWFPPTNGVAVNRMKAFANYLGDNFIVEVFTLGDRDEKKETTFGTVHYYSSKSILNKIKHKNSDGRLLHNLKSLVNIIASRLRLSQLKTWKKKVNKNFKQIHTKNPFDIIISSYAPVEPHDIAVELCKEFCELIWIADMRDEMSSNPFSSASDKKFLKKKEASYVNYLSGLISVSKPILEDFKEIYPSLNNFEEIRNGFDHDFVPSYHFNSEFTIVYAGMFYGKRKPGLFFEALLSALKKNRIKPDFKIKFIGTTRNFSIPVEIEDHIEFIPPVCYLEAIKEMSMADCNLLINPPLGTLGQFSGKVFDYLSVEKPILALVDTKDVAAELIRDHNGGIATDFFSVEDIENGLCEIYNYWKRKEVFPVKRNKTNELHRKFQVEKLERFILNILQK